MEAFSSAKYLRGLLAPFPETGKIEVSPALAGELLKAAESLPLYDNKEFHSPALQNLVLDRIRESSPDGFDGLVSLIKERIAQRPYCVLVQGLRLDEGNRLFIAICWFPGGYDDYLKSEKG